MVFAQQGTDNKLNFAGISAKNSIKLNYLNVPVFLKIYVGKVVNFQFGPQFGILLSGRRVGQSSYFTGSYGSGYQTEDTDITASFKNDFALCGGIGIDLANGFTSSLRINYGFSDINNDAQDKVVRDYLGIGGIHNRGIQLTVGYLFDFGKNK